MMHSNPCMHVPKHKRNCAALKIARLGMAKLEIARLKIARLRIARLRIARLNIDRLRTDRCSLNSSVHRPPRHELTLLWCHKYHNNPTCLATLGQQSRRWQQRNLPGSTFSHADLTASIVHAQYTPGHAHAEHMVHASTTQHTA